MAGYNGPIIFIVHSPFPNLRKDISPISEIGKAMYEHNKKILKLIRFGRNHRIPIIYGHGENIPNEFLLELEKAIFVDLGRTNWKEEIKKAFQKYNITPSRVIIGGHFTEMCLNEVEKHLNELFPRTEIIELKKSYSLSMVHRQNGYSKGSEFRKVLNEQKARRQVKRKPLSKKLL